MQKSDFLQTLQRNCDIRKPISPLNEVRFSDAALNLVELVATRWCTSANLLFSRACIASSSGAPDWPAASSNLSSLLRIAVSSGSRVSVNSCCNCYHQRNIQNIIQETKHMLMLADATARIGLR